jgi:hypothetical protein
MNVALYSKINIIMTWHVETLNDVVNEELNALALLRTNGIQS